MCIAILRILYDRAHKKCSMLHFVTASFDSIGVVRIASTHYAHNMDFPVITWGRGEGEASSRRIVLDQCAVGLSLYDYSMDIENI